MTQCIVFQNSIRFASRGTVDLFGVENYSNRQLFFLDVFFFFSGNMAGGNRPSGHFDLDMALVGDGKPAIGMLRFVTCTREVRLGGSPYKLDRGLRYLDH